jgi:hypothetical protein
MMIKLLPGPRCQQQHLPQQVRYFGSRRRHFRRPSYQSHYDYWDKEYQKSKQEMMKNRVDFKEPKEFNGTLTWKPMLFMAISPLILCLFMPDVRQNMFTSFQSGRGDASADVSSSLDDTQQSLPNEPPPPPRSQPTAPA